MRQLSITLTDRQAGQLDAIALRYEETRSAILRRAWRDWLDRYERETGPTPAGEAAR